MGYEPDVGMELVGNSGWTSRVQPKGVAEEQTEMRQKFQEVSNSGCYCRTVGVSPLYGLKNEFRLIGII